ncbi:MAG TPA: extracellular solute-binding protein [Chloroflexota bacterium]
MSSAGSMSRRVLLGLLGSVVPAAALAACGASSTVTSASTSAAVASGAAGTTTGAATSAVGSSASTAAQPTAAAAAAPGGQKVTLQFFSWNTGPAGTVEKSQTDAFVQANPGYTVQEVPTTASNIDQKLNTAIAAGTPPDLFTHGPAATAVYAAPKQTISLDSYIAQVAGLQADFPPPVLAGGTWHGHVYQVQWLANAGVLVYRTDYFKDAGLDPTKPPQTWNDLATDGQKLAQWNGSTIKRVGYNQPTTSFAAQQQFFAFAYQNGSPLFNADFSQAQFNDSASLEALQFAHDLVYKYKTTSATPITGDVPNVPLLVTGQVAMSWESPQAITYARTYKQDTAASLTDSLPFQKVRAGTFLGGLGLQITSVSKHPDDAWKLIAWYLDPARMADIAQANGQMPGRSSSAQVASWIKSDPIMQNAVKAISIGVANPTIPSWIEMRNTAIVPAVEQVMANKGDVKTALDTAVQKANTLLQADLKKYGA